MKVTQETDNVNEMLEAALGYASRGWPVLPLHWPAEGRCSCGKENCTNPGKHPLTQHGKDDASNDLDTIRGWWEKWPEANIGVATGKQSGVLVVDIDPRNGGDPQELPKDLPDTPIALTGGGGWHYYFLHPENGLKVPGKLPGSPGIDLKGAGGYVVAPPSRHASGKNYEWQSGHGSFPLAPLPASLMELITATPTSQSTEVVGEQNIPEGNRNSTLTSLAGAMRRKGMTAGEINCALQKVNEDRCTPPLTDLEVRGIARSLARYAPEAEEWEEPGEIPEPQQLSVPALPEGLLPKSLAPWLQDCAERLCLPLEMIATPALVSLGALVGRSVGICPKEQDDWLVVPNLWGGVIARPGWMKSPAINEAMRPFQQLATKAHEEIQLILDGTGAREDCLQAQIDGIKQRMRSAVVKGTQDEFSSLEVELAQLKNALREAKVVERRYVTQDPTVEKLGELLQQNPRGLLLLRDELSGWLRTLDKSGREGEREFYLEAWNGTQPFTFDRIGRGTVHIPSTTLSIFGGIQPGKLRAYVAGAMENGRGADGLLQRFQVLVWPDSIPRWKNVDRAPNAAALNNASNIFQFLDQRVPAHWGEGIGEVRGIPALRFDPEAQEFFNSWRDRLEQRLRSDEMAGRDAFESHLAKYRSLMPSLALLHHLVEVAAGTCSNPKNVGLIHAEVAAAWCDFLEAHAERIYAAEGPERAAHALARRIQEGKVQNNTTCREIYRHGWANLENRDRVKMAIEALEEAHWVKVEEISPGPEGGRPLLRVLINPKLRVSRG